MKNIILVDVDKLICHEKINPKRLKKLLRQIKQDKILKKPLVVDEKTMIILDGHHRHLVFQQLGIKKIPCFLVDYLDKNIRVAFRRPEVRERLIKEIVMQKAKSGKLFPFKTTKHFLPLRPTINIRISSL